MSDIFKEVDDALKQEKVEKFWHDNGKHIIMVIVALLIGTALGTYYNHYLHSQTEEQTATLFSLQDTTPEDIETALADLNPEQKALAYFTLAGQALQNDNPQNAYDYYVTVTKSGAGNELRALGAYYARSLALEPDNELPFNEIDYPRGTIWQAHLDMTQAVYMVEENGDYTRALEVINGLLEENSEIPDSLALRLNQLREIYQYEQDAAAAENGPAAN